MNHLAHLLLAGPDPALRAGGFLGDFVRGGLDGTRPAELELGIALHRHLDASTDRHPAVLAAVAQFRPPWRRWAPVALDVWFDHLLARAFEPLTGHALATFAATAYDDLELHRAHFPAPALQFLERMQARDLLVRYGDRETISGVLGHLSRRSPRAAPLADIDGELDRLAPVLQACFTTLLPDLQAASRLWRTRRGQNVD
ncbi:MAG TPA: ACP phosphodiesterase [Pseudomonadales bacterium]|nr:ACP phosphodiesterase [Pseudomonadales bacterium]